LRVAISLLELRYANGDYDRLPSLVADLIKGKVDLILASGLSAVRAARNATDTIPIVMVGAMDPVGFELSTYCPVTGKANAKPPVVEVTPTSVRAGDNLRTRSGRTEES
jgi:ABC-type uncharacterized transport system substrate-binding protein